MKWPERRIENWNEFTQVMEILNLENYFSTWMFRGQPNKDWPLIPSIMRIINSHRISNIEAALRIEMSIYREFRDQAHLISEFKEMKEHEVLYWFTVMQHYGCPTRLLDWSYSPFNALYFAVSGGFDQDGAVYLFNEKLLFENTEHQTINMEEILEYPMTNHIATLLPFFHTKRSRIQQGCFTISSNLFYRHDEAIYNVLHPFINNENTPLMKFIIPAQLKIMFLSKLRYLNVKADILYPDLHGLGQYLKDITEIRGFQTNESFKSK